jgi:VanZ family protein
MHPTTLVFRLAFAVTIVTVTRLATMPIHAAPLFTMSDKVAHVTAFLVLAFFLDQGWPRLPFERKKVAVLLVYGMVLEVVQHFLPYRLFSLLDFAADAAGVGVYALAAPFIANVPWIARPRSASNAVRSDD